MKPSSPRTGCSVIPLVEAADMYPELEHLLLDARETVWLSFRVFDPDTKLRSKRSKKLGLSDWSALIAHTVKRGVEVRIRSEEHTSELQSLMRISYAVFCLKKKN